MVLSWINFLNGDTGLNIRNALNTFLTNVETQVNSNTSAVDSNISTINALLAPNYTNYTPQDPIPDYQEGKLFYSDVCKDVCVWGETDDTPISLGQMATMLVKNTTGVPIYKGEACTYNGAEAGYPIVKLALADNFRNAIVLGIAMHDIPHNEVGHIVTHGKVVGFNTLAHETGIPLYLSDTIPGTYSDVAPAIISQVGGSTYSDVADGKLMVNLRSNIVLPTTLGFLSGVGVNTYNLVVTPQNVVNYTEEIAVVASTDKVNGTIAVAGTGLFSAHFTCGYTFTSVASTRAITFEMYNITTASVVGQPLVQNIPRDATENSFSTSMPIELADGDEVVVRVKSVPDMDISFTALSFNVESVHIR